MGERVGGGIFGRGCGIGGWWIGRLGGCEGEVFREEGIGNGEWGMGKREERTRRTKRTGRTGRDEARRRSAEGKTWKRGGWAAARRWGGEGRTGKGAEGRRLGDGAPRAKLGKGRRVAGVDRGVHASAQDYPKGWPKD